MYEKIYNISMKILNKNLAHITLLIAFVFMLVAPGVSFADSHPSTGDSGTTTVVNPLGTDSINGLIKIILIGVIKIGIPLIAIMLVYTGFLYVMARGKPAAIETANQSLLYTLLGAAILLGSWAIAQLISNTVLQL